METFETYLTRHKLRASTQLGYKQDLALYERWIKSRGKDLDNTDYNDLLDYMETCQTRSLSRSTINSRLRTLRHYYRWKKERGERTDNPAQDLGMKSTGKPLLQDVLNAEELERLYERYAHKPSWSFAKEDKGKHRRNTVLLGLLVYQGLQTTELKKLEKRHVKITEGKIYIPSSTKSNSRTLKLEAQQILPLHAYLNELKEEKLFTKLDNALKWLMQQLRQGTGKKVKNAYHLRASVIMQWLKQYNLREVQYMAGHKYIGSTERYKESEVEDLQEAIEKYHPFR